MTGALTTIGLDADDTLWHNERYFALTQERFADLLSPYTEVETLMARLLAAERRNLPHYGFGIKGFTLSMIETAIEITQGRVSADAISQILTAGRDMLAHPVELLPGVLETLETLKNDYKLILITKGDLLDQERKLAQSNLRGYFDAVEIVSDKTAATYKRIFDHHGDGAARGLMAGNSMKSDVLPMIQAGGWGIYVPFGLVWDVEHAAPPTDTSRYGEIQRLDALPDILREKIIG